MLGTQIIQIALLFLFFFSAGSSVVKVEKGVGNHHLNSGDTVFVGEQNCGGRDILIVLIEVEEAIVDHVSSYRGILSITPLPIFDGGELLQNHLEKKSKEGIPLKIISHSLGGKDSMTKGVVHGGLEKDFSPLKTRSARKLGREKQFGESNCIIVVDGLRALRAQKALAKSNNIIISTTTT
jgi:hypothetical protein